MMHKLSIFITLLFYTVIGMTQVKDTIVEYTIKNSIDISDNPDSLYTFKWNENYGYWTKNERFIYTYNDNNDLGSEEKSTWEGTYWLPEDKIKYLYTDQMLSFIIEEWWDFYYEEWINKNRQVFLYDSVNNISEITINYWSEFNQEWINDSLVNYEYNALNQLSYAYYDAWSLFINEWEKHLKINYTYDTLGNNTHETHYYWEYDLLIWESLRRYLRIFNNNNQMTGLSHYVADNQNNWLNNWKREYTYENHLLNEEIYYVWLDFNESWLEDYKFDNTYDELNRLSVKTGYIYDWDIFVWEKHFQVRHEYLEERHLKRSTYYTWSTQNYEWIKLEKHEFYYPGYIVNTYEPLAFNLDIYPNPTSEFISISTKKPGIIQHVSLYEITGKKVIGIEGVQQKPFMQINIDGFNPGIYILYMIIDDTPYSEKIIIR